MGKLLLKMKTIYKIKSGIEDLNSLTIEFSDFLVEQTVNEVQAANDDNFELAAAIKKIINDTIIAVAAEYAKVSKPEYGIEYWSKHFNKQYKYIHKELTNE